MNLLRSTRGALYRALEAFVLTCWKSYRYILLSLLLAVIFAAIVPYDADEFYQYQPLFCRYYPLNVLNTFRAGCQAYDLNFLNTGLVLPLRSYFYSGSFPVLYYYPIFLLWKSPVSARWMGLLFLLAQSWILRREFGFKPAAVFAALLLTFPYMFQHVVDTGPVAFHITSVYLLLLCFRRWMTTLRLRWPLLAAVIMFLGVWTKLVYLLLLPGIGVLLLLAYIEQQDALKNTQAGRRLLGQLVVFVAVAALLCASLFLSTDPQHPSQRPLLEQLTQGSSYSFPELTQRFWELPVVQIMLNPLAATHRIYEPKPFNALFAVYDILLYGSIPVLLLILLLRAPASWRRLLPSAALYGVFLLTFFLIARTKITWAMHHAVLSFPFLILSYCFLLQSAQSLPARLQPRRTVRALTGVFVSLNALWFVAFPTQPVRSINDPSKKTVNTMLAKPALAQSHIYVITDWSMYFYQGLYGHDAQSVVYIRPLNEPSQIETLRQLAADHGRRLLFVINTREPASDVHFIRSHVRLQRCGSLPESAVWQVFAEEAGC